MYSYCESFEIFPTGANGATKKHTKLQFQMGSWVLCQSMQILKKNCTNKHHERQKKRKKIGRCNITRFFYIKL